MIKLLALDLDGTLLYPKRRISIMIRKNTKFLKRFVEKGGSIILVSGRNPMMQVKVEKKIKTKVPFLGCNGSFLLESGMVIKGDSIPNDIGLGLYAKMKNKFGIITWLLLDSTDKIYMTFGNVNIFLKFAVKLVNRLSLQYKENITYGEKPFVEALKNNTYYKIMPVFGLGKKGKKYAREAVQAVSDIYSHQLFVVDSNNALEISAHGTSKGNALLDYCRENGFSSDEVIVAGDSGNDISMFEHFEHSFAMAHAPKYVREKAKRVIKRVYEIEEYINELENNDKIV